MTDKMTDDQVEKCRKCHIDKDGYWSRKFYADCVPCLLETVDRLKAENEKLLNRCDRCKEPDRAMTIHELEAENAQQKKTLAGNDLYMTTADKFVSDLQKKVAELEAELKKKDEVLQSIERDHPFLYKERMKCFEKDAPQPKEEPDRLCKHRISDCSCGWNPDNIPEDSCPCSGYDDEPDKEVKE